MKTYSLSKFTGGWFIGNFTPTLLDTEKFEVAVKYYKSGDKDIPHFHKVADEYTVIITGAFKINGNEYSKGDIIHFSPKEISLFECIEEGVTAVVKMPSVKGDKFVVTEDEK